MANRPVAFAGVGFVILFGCAALQPKADEPEPTGTLDCSTVAQCEPARDHANEMVQACLQEHQSAECGPWLSYASAVSSRIDGLRERDERAKRDRQREQIQADQDEKERRKAQEIAVAREHGEVVLKWMREIVADAPRTLSCAACNSPSAEIDASEDDRNSCSTQCVAMAHRAMDDIVSTSLADCVAGRTRGCKLVYVNPDLDPSGDLEACNQRCGRARTPVASHPTQTPASGGSCGGNARCCDGACSPTCACPGHGGCCSRHGGVCGC